MSKTRLVLSSLVAVLVLSAVVASTASGAEWFVNGAKLTGAKAVDKNTGVMENFKLLFSSTTIECTGLEIENGQIEPTNRGSTSGILFTNCSATAGSICSLVGQPINIKTVPLTVLAELKSGAEASALFAPKTKTVLATLNFTGASCALSGVQPVTGHVTAVGPTLQIEAKVQEFVVHTAAGEIKVGTAEAVLEGKVLVKLLSGEPWSFH